MLGANAILEVVDHAWATRVFDPKLPPRDIAAQMSGLSLYCADPSNLRCIVFVSFDDPRAREKVFEMWTCGGVVWREVQIRCYTGVLPWAVCVPKMFGWKLNAESAIQGSTAEEGQAHSVVRVLAFTSIT